MKIDRIIGSILSILIVIYLVIQKYDNKSINENSLELLSDSGYQSYNIATLDKKTITSNDSITDIIEFINPYNYSIELNQSDVTISCHGAGETKESDELLVSSNYSIKAKFSKEKNGILHNSLVIDKREKAYIHVISEYKGTLPNNQVDCNYQVRVISN